jgi:hypothetical protein
MEGLEIIVVSPEKRLSRNAPHPKASTLSTRKRVLFSFLVFVAFYVIVEIICSTVAFIHYSRLSHYVDSFWIFEDSGRTVQFDAIRGYRLTTIPSRFARVTNGSLEYVGTLRGNSQGFPDRHDFTRRQPPSVVKRYVVFGDSFTAAQFIQQNWPDFIEEQLYGEWQLLNFSTDGGGLGNWWSNLTRIVDKEGYDFDEVIFAVYPGDLKRTFSVAEHRGYDRHMFGRAGSWDVNSLPRTVEEAKQCMAPLPSCYIVTPQEFEIALRNKRLDRPRQSRSVQESAWLTYTSYAKGRYYFLRAMSRIFPGDGQAKNEGPIFDRGQLGAISDIRECLSARGGKAIVVHIPSRWELMEHLESTAGKDEAREFARQLGARFVDGSDAFRQLNAQQIRDDWLPTDGHWGQNGSDRFGRFMIKVLQEEAEATRASNSEGIGG